MELQEAFEAGFEAVKAYVDASFDAFEARIGAVEKQLVDERKTAPVGASSAVIDRNGNLVITMTDGGTKDLGVVVGKDGDPGRDGFNLKDFDATVMEDGRTVLLSFTGKDMDFKVELGFPVMLYRGVHKAETSYERGDTVTFGGSLWHCDKATASKPGDGSGDWTLCAKKGRDGKDGIVKEVGSPAPIRVGVPSKGE